MAGGLISSSDVPILRKIINEFKRRRKNESQSNRKRWHGSPGPKLKRAVISELGDYDVHRVTLLSGTFTEDLETDDLAHTRQDVEAYVAEEIDYPLVVGDVVWLVKTDSRYWIIEAKQNCEGYCIDPDFSGNSYVYGWSFRAPNLPCCPEASGAHVLTTSDSGATYETSTFQCNSDGTDRKWLFKDNLLRITPMLSEGNIEYRTDNAPEWCTVNLQRYEWSRFPSRDDCGKIPKAVCLNPICGVGGCEDCNGKTPKMYLVTIGGSMDDNPANVGDDSWCQYVPGQYLMGLGMKCPSTTPCTPYEFWCEWGIEDRSVLNSELTTVPRLIISPIDPITMRFIVGGGGESVTWDTEDELDCNSKITLTLNYLSYTESTHPCTGMPETITVEPIGEEFSESECYPKSLEGIYDSGELVCDYMPHFLEFELSGVTDNTCTSCNEFNVLTRMSLGGTTDWYSSNIDFTCSEVDNGVWRILYTNTATTLKLQFRKFNTTTIVEYEGPLIADANCFKGPVVFDYSSDNGECDNWPSEITVYPIADTT